MAGFFSGMGVLQSTSSVPVCVRVVDKGSTLN